MITVVTIDFHKAQSLRLHCLIVIYFVITVAAFGIFGQRVV